MTSRYIHTLRLPGLQFQCFIKWVSVLMPLLAHVLWFTAKNTWIQVYQKKVKVEIAIVDLVRQMSNILSFVEDTEVLKAKLKNFSDCIHSLLKMIEDCSQNIHSYLSTGDIGKNNLQSDFINWLSFQVAPGKPMLMNSSIVIMQRNSILWPKILIIMWWFMLLLKVGIFEVWYEISDDIGLK